MIVLFFIFFYFKIKKTKTFLLFLTWSYFFLRTVPLNHLLFSAPLLHNSFHTIFWTNIRTVPLDQILFLYIIHFMLIFF